MMGQGIWQVLRTGNVIGIGVAVALANAAVDLCRAIAQAATRQPIESAGLTFLLVAILALAVVAKVAVHNHSERSRDE